MRRPIESALETARERGITIINPFCGMPVCMTFGMMPLEANSEFVCGVEVRQKGISSEALARVESSKTRTPTCRDCYLRSFCLGLWKAYYEIRGDVVEPPFRSLRFWPQG